MISRELLTEALHRMFELAPTAICISTSEITDSRYVQVNNAYLQLLGRSWAELKSERLIDKTSIMSEGKQRRARLLDEQGFYKLEEVEIRHASGRIIPTLISAQRIVLDGQAVDLEIIVDISDRKELEQKLTEAASIDVLTGLANRAAFDTHLTRSLSAANLVGGRVGLAFVDLNSFKAINDEFGHATGDRFLQVIGHRLRSHCRPEDYVARIGGDEFCIIFKAMMFEPRRLHARLQQVAEQVFAPVHLSPLILDASAAIGVAVSTTDESAEELLRRADALMYRAKAHKPKLVVEL